MPMSNLMNSKGSFQKQIVLLTTLFMLFKSGLLIAKIPVVPLPRVVKILPEKFNAARDFELNSLLKVTVSEWCGQLSEATTGFKSS